MSDTPAAIDWEKNPLIATVAQEASSGEVLMVAWMDQEALELTLSTGYAHYFSRSRQRIWKKGESSGHVQKVQQALLDCDQDAVVLKVEQTGVACHTGRPSCFFTDLQSGETLSEPQTDVSAIYGVVDTLYQTIQSRKKADPESSYVAKLFAKGENSYLKKIVEEAGELTFAMKDRNENEIVYEAADLLFHTLVGLAAHDITPDRIRQELARREGLSGLEEKKQRTR